MALPDPGMVRKPRSKVSKACDNCRRRKIKCTGRQPCNNCVTYQCECVYAKSPSPGGNNIRVKVSTSDDLSSINSDSVESNISGITNVNKSWTENTRNSCSEDACSASSAAIFDPAVDGIPDAAKNTDTNPNRNPTCNDTTNVDNNTKNICDSARSAATCSDPAGSTPISVYETDLATFPSLELQFGNNGLYMDDIEFQKQLIQLQTTLKQLKSMSVSNSHIKDAIENITAQVNRVVLDWEPQYDLNQFNSTIKNGPESLKSIETHLMKNKYYDQVHLTRFSVWTDTSKTGKQNNSENAFWGNQPLVDDIFGLYSPLQGLSLRGIGHFFQQCTVGPETKDKTIQLKETLYLLLRFFDLCVDHFNQSCVSIANPLESYLHRKNLLNLSPSTTSSVISRSSANNKDLVSVLINRLPQPFVMNLTSVSNEQLSETMYDDFAMFNIVLQMYDCHKKGFEALMMRITARPSPESPATEISPTDLQNFIHFCEEEELLLALCYSYYNSTFYHFDECSGHLKYFELLLSLLETQIWLGEGYGFEKVLDIAVNYAMGLGLSRWEYYVGLDEETAEKRRTCWWKLYCIDKRFAFKSGHLSSIDDSKMNCLLPKVFRDLGFTDSRDFLSRVHLVQRSSAFDNKSISELKFYGECAASQVISGFYSNVLYDERYTSIKNTAKPPFLKSQLLDEVFCELDSLKAKCDAIKNQTSKLFEIGSSKCTSNTSVSKDDKSQAAQYALFHECLFFTVLTSASNLIVRLLVLPKSPTITDICIKYAAFLHDSWGEMTQLILSLDDDYTVNRAFHNYSIVCLLIVSRAFTKLSFIRTAEELVMVLRVFKRLSGISIYDKTKDNEIVASSRAYNDFNRLLTFVSINLHSMLLGYMYDHDLTREELFHIIKQAGPDVADLPPTILNPKSDIYKCLMEPVQTSGFHLNVKRMLERDEKVKDEDMVPTENYPKTAVQFMASASAQSGERTFSSIIAPLSPVDCHIKDSSYPLLPSIRSLTSGRGNPNDPNHNGPTYFSEQQPPFQVQKPTQDMLQSRPVNDDASYKAYNLGTLDEFVNNGDLNDLCSTLWSDLYSDEKNQPIFVLNDYIGSSSSLENP